MKYKIAVIFVFIYSLIFVPEIVNAQETDSLSVNSEAFFQKISATLLNTPSKVNKEKSQILLDRLYARWSIGRFNKEEKDAVRSMFEAMQAKKLKSYPFLYDYVNALMLLSESHLVPKSIIGWHIYAEQGLQSRSSRNFTKFADFTIDLLENDRLSNEKSISWYHRQARFKFVLDTNFLVKFEKFNLILSTRKDSTMVLETEGIFNYDQQHWIGKKGKIEWRRFGDSIGEKIYVELDNYKINTGKSNFSIDSAVLHYGRFFKHPVIGRFTEKIMASSPNKRTSYPRFESYLDNFELNDIYPNVTYHGGFYLNGMKLYGSGNENADAYVTLYQGGNKVGKVISEVFLLDEERLESKKSSVIFYFEEDSLFHPGLRFRYFTETSELQLFSNEEGADMIPFFDSYHQMNIYSPALFWNVDSTLMHFRRIKGVHSENVAAFVSNNYYAERDFYRLQGMDEIHPMYIIQNYLKSYNEREIKLNALAQFMKKSPEQVSSMLIRLSNSGFLVYNSKTKSAIVNDKFFDFLNAKSGRADYDVMRFESSVNNTANATIDLQSLSLDVFGVPEVKVSDSQQVYIYPYDNSISIKKNRDFTFDGRVQMGLFDFYSRENVFVYDSFMINMSYIDSMAFQVYSTDSLVQIDSLIRVKNIIADLNGTIYIDMPFNKSGLKPFHQFPIFESDETSYVYFNDPMIQDSALLPELFYFKVEPFKFDSVISFSTQGMAFTGSLVSGGIFPTIVEPLVVMPDYSLGFRHTTPENGLPLYGGKGTFTDTVFLSNDGFTGSGRLDYLSAHAVSDQFIFYPDSLIGQATGFKVLESPTEYDFPFASADTVNLNWVIDTNVLFVENPIDSFRIYRDAKFDGGLNLHPEYMGGIGSFYFEESEIQSKYFTFHFTNLEADSADFFLRKDADTLVFQSNGYLAKLDFEQQKGWFHHSYENTFVEFPYNRFISNLDEVEWFMDEDKIVLFSDLTTNYQALDTLSDLDLIDYKLSGPEFISTDVHPDSILRFYAGKATYNLNTFNIDVENVKMVKSADAAIFPNNESVKIIRDGGIGLMENARIIADTINKYHFIYEAEVNLISRHKYFAKGYTDYVDRNKARQPIYMLRIEVNSYGISTGLGDLEPTEIFFLSPEYFFTGQISFRADRSFLNFDGGYRINEDCVGQEDKWVAFEKNLDPNNIFFDINEESMDLNKQRIRYGLAHSAENKNFYPLILQSPENPGDDVLIESFGRIDYDTASAAFRVGSGVFDQDGYSEDNFVTLNTQRCILEGDGILDMGMDFSEFNITTAGKFRHLVIPDSTYLDAAMLLDFHFDKDALNMIIDSLRLVSSTIKNPGEGNFPLFLKKVLGSDKSGKLVTELSLYGQMVKVPKKLEHTLILSELNMKWDPQSRAFVSKGPIGIGYIAGIPVNKYVKGYVEVEKNRTSGGITIYLELTKDQWYFFSYKHGIMQVLSSDNTYNDYISLMKPSKRILNAESDTEYYEFVISTRRKVIDFIRKMEKTQQRL